LTKIEIVHVWTRGNRPPSEAGSFRPSIRPDASLR
jgi:hypothetical protein